MIDSLLNLYGGVLVLSLRVEWAHLDVALRRIGCGLLAGPNSDGTVTQQAATADVVVVTNGPSVKHSRSARGCLDDRWSNLLCYRRGIPCGRTMQSQSRDACCSICVTSQAAVAALAHARRRA